MLSSSGGGYYAIPGGTIKDDKKKLGVVLSELFVINTIHTHVTLYATLECLCVLIFSIKIELRTEL